MGLDPSYKPKLRPVEAFRLPAAPGDGLEAELVGLRDGGGLSDVILTMSLPALQLLTFMDGTRTCGQLLVDYERIYDRSLHPATLESMIGHLEQAHFLEGPGFEGFYDSLVQAYLEAPVRGMPHAAALGIDSSGQVFDRWLMDAEAVADAPPVRGVVAPHLDYERGLPCYAAAYAALKPRPTPDRVVILGTNHFGRSSSVVATGKDFDTPLGRTVTDRAFLERLEDRLGPLRKHEFDHAREHSVELQVAWLQRLYGAEAFTIVPVLCHDPCGPNGAAPYDADGVDLRDFAETIGKLIAEDDADTLVVAGADLSHVGVTFGDERMLDETFLAEVAVSDQTALARLEHAGADEFVDALRATGNRTRVCSAGCIFAAATALSGARPSIVRYHQAADMAAQNCVTCAAVVFT